MPGFTVDVVSETSGFENADTAWTDARMDIWLVLHVISGEMTKNTAVTHKYADTYITLR